MSIPKYVFDTNIFINLKNIYPSDIFTSLWNQIETLFSDGIIISSDEVIDEIKRGNDDLEKWAKARKNSFYPSNEPVQMIAKEILVRFSGLVTNPKKPNTADPFLIALARHMACTVVTEENRSGSDLSPKIPNICDYYSIRCIKFVEFLRENKITS
jgi:predicted nucleic acid-binding protein